MSENPLFDLNDISLIPTIISDISSRAECIPYHKNEFLPLMVAPMDTVIDDSNIQMFLDNRIIPCIPRGKYLNPIYKHYAFKSFGLNEIEEHLYKDLIHKPDEKCFFNYPNVLIDIANGHMAKLINIVKTIVAKYPNVTIMVGNVANPLTYKNLSLAGAHYIRIGIGGGSVCTTSANSAVHYPMGSLISECYKIKKESNLKSFIVADGGFKGYDDIIKAYSLGCDYVMCGSLFNKAIESTGFNYFYGIKVSNKIANYLFNKGFTIKKKYRGMSTKAVQRSWGLSKLRTSEGITKYQKVEYTLKKWTENFEHYLKTSMSYCGAKTLYEFIGETEWKFITQNAYLRFKK